MKIMLVAICLMLLTTGCSHIPIKDGELQVGKNTTATIEDLGAVRINNRF